MLITNIKNQVNDKLNSFVVPPLSGQSGSCFTFMQCGHLRILEIDFFSELSSIMIPIVT